MNQNLSSIDQKLLQVTFEGVAGSSFTGDLAIDDVSISNGSCFGQTVAPPTQVTTTPSSTAPPSFPPASTQMNNVSVPTSSPAVVSCNFDNILCYGWQQSYSDVFDWKRHTGSTSSIRTGPSSDHTTGYGKVPLSKSRFIKKSLSQFFA